MWWTTGAALAATRSEEAPEKPEIVLIEAGPFEMKDKRGYKTQIILGPRFIPPGIGGRVLRSLDDNLTLMVGGGYSNWSLFGLSARHVDARAGLDLQPLGNGMHGVYLGPRVVYRSLEASVASFGEPVVEHRSGSLGVGAVAGWRSVWNPGLSAGFGLGATYNSWVAGEDADVIEQEGDVKVLGILPVVEATLGWSF
ncbi:MAG: hypothetical protein ABMA64_14170 [Myxococcota bacterium]